MEKKVKVLYFVDRMLRGGIQTFVLENIKHMDKNKIQIDFLLLDDGKEYELENDLRTLGCNIYKLKGMWIRKITDFIKYNRALEQFFKEHHDYKVVHLHSSSKNYLVLKKAKKYGIPERISHSHNIDFQTKNIIKKSFGNLFKIPLRKYSTKCLACSEDAGKWLFGNKIVQSDKFMVIHNAIDLEKFRYNESIREKVREELGIANDCLVLGHVGRYTNQKNHEFLIDIFNEIHKQKSNSKLLLVGTGENENKIKEKVNNLNLNEKVIFLGFKNNVNDYMFAMDLFVFPSKFEGLGIVLIEAQATGMKCYTSKYVVPKEAKVSELLEFIDLKEGAKVWADKILNDSTERNNQCEKIKDNGYDINVISEKLMEVYIRSERK